MAVIDFAALGPQRARRRRQRILARRSPGRLSLGTFAQGRPWRRAVLEVAASSGALIGAVAALTALRAWLGLD
jgi:hypothetical protein